jgi:nicotinamidase-related amidase
MFAMRLPADAALVVIDAQYAIDDPCWGPRNNPRAETAIAALLQAWRLQELPIVHVRHDSIEPRSPYRPDAPGHGFKAEAAPLPGERIVAKTSPSAFAATDLEAALDDFGATTLVFCGVLTHNSVEATVRAASGLGYRAFVVADACWSVDVVDLRGRRWAAEDVHALSLTHLHREYAQVVTLPETLVAAAGARIRERLRARRGG